MVHRVEAVIRPQRHLGKTILLVVHDADNLGAADRARKALFERWGYDVNLLNDNASSSAYESAVENADVVYVSERVWPSSVQGKLDDVKIGVVNEEGFLDGSLGLSGSNGTAYPDNRIDITDNGHYITSPFETGSLTLSLTSQSLRHHGGLLAAGASAGGGRRW